MTRRLRIVPVFTAPLPVYLVRHFKITLTLDTHGHLHPDEAAGTVARLPPVERITLRPTGTMVGPTEATREGAFNGSRVPAASPATRVRIYTKQDDPVGGTNAKGS